MSSFFYAKICSLLARRRSSQPVQRVYWPENVIDWLGKWRPTCVMRHARGQKLQSFRRKWPFYMDLYSMPMLCIRSIVHHINIYSRIAIQLNMYVKIITFSGFKSTILTDFVQGQLRVPFRFGRCLPEVHLFTGSCRLLRRLFDLRLRARLDTKWKKTNKMRLTDSYIDT